MSTIAEIKEAVEKLSARERAELETMLWPDWNRPEGENPPGIQEKLAAAAKGRFQSGDRSSIGRILSSLE